MIFINHIWMEKKEDKNMGKIVAIVVVLVVIVGVVSFMKKGK